VAFEEVMVAVEGKGFAKVHQQYSPNGLVPCVHDDDGTIVWDSLAIAEYLAERSPAGAVWPENPRARVLARCISAEMHSGFGDVRATMPMNIKTRVAGMELSEKVAQQVERIEELWTDARTTYGVPSGAGPYLFGKFTAADAFYAPIVWRFFCYNVPLKSALARQYVADMLRDTFMKEWEAGALAETNPIPHYDEAAVSQGGGLRAPSDEVKATAGTV
jgi:glutathione S-transferase